MTTTIERHVPFLSDDGGGFIITTDRWKAARIIRQAEIDMGGDVYPISSYTVRRCYVRPAIEGDWVLDEYGAGVMECEAAHPDAEKGWRVTP